jgi:LPPG:FO 2-phospho-L-lactate transferase
MTDDPVATFVFTDEGELPFQEYFVRRRCEPRVTGFRFTGIDSARPAPGILECVENASLIVICPSNPWVSIEPILGIPGIKDALITANKNGVPILAVSPIIGGAAVKGPAAKMYADLGTMPSAYAVARHYYSSLGEGVLSGFILDSVDVDQVRPIQAMGMQTLSTNILMSTSGDRHRLADEVLSFRKRIVNV